MSKSVDNLIKFLDDAGPKMDAALKSTDKVNFIMVMDKIMEDFLNVDLGTPKRKARAPKRKVRRGIGSY